MGFSVCAVELVGWIVMKGNVRNREVWREGASVYTPLLCFYDAPFQVRKLTFTYLVQQIRSINDAVLLGYQRTFAMIFKLGTTAWQNHEAVSCPPNEIYTRPILL